MSDLQPTISEGEATGLVILRIAGNIYDALKTGDQVEAEEQACWLVAALLAYRLADGIVVRLAEALGLSEETTAEVLAEVVSAGTGVKDDEDDSGE